MFKRNQCNINVADLFVMSKLLFERYHVIDGLIIDNSAVNTIIPIVYVAIWECHFNKYCPELNTTPMTQVLICNFISIKSSIYIYTDEPLRDSTLFENIDLTLVLQLCSQVKDKIDIDLAVMCDKNLNFQFAVSMIQGYDITMNSQSNVP